MLSAFANPARFMALSRPLAPALGGLGLVLLAWGLWLGFQAPPDYQQGDTVLIMFVHVPAAYMGLFAYACLGAASFAGLVWRHALADAAAKAAAPLGAGFTFLALLTGSLWGKPMWGAWWVWDARLTSVLVLFLFYLGYLALHAAVEDEAKAARAAAVLALVGLLTLSPCESFLPVYLSGVSYGWAGFLLLTGVLAGATLVAMLAFTSLSMLGVARLRLALIERYENLLLGLALALLGLVVLVLEG